MLVCDGIKFSQIHLHFHTRASMESSCTIKCSVTNQQTPVHGVVG